MSWTLEAEQIVREKWIQGHTGPEISQFLSEIGIIKSRNAVIGKAHRLGLRRSQSETLEEVPQVEVKKSKPKPKPKPKKKAAARPRPSPRVNKVDCGDGVSIWDLEPNSCRWPIGSERGADQRFCGAPAENSISGDGPPYCCDHIKLAISHWTPEQREAHSQRMKEYHTKRKNQGR